MEVNENPGRKVQIFRTDLSKSARVLTPAQRLPGMGLQNSERV